MPYIYKISKNLERILEKLHKKNKPLYEQVLKKMDEIINAYDLEHYKNLKYDMKDSKRVHVGHFVLIFQLNKNPNYSEQKIFKPQTETGRNKLQSIELSLSNKKESLVLFDDFDHHDNVYRRR